jgi:hypothetical protein
MRFRSLALVFAVIAVLLSCSRKKAPVLAPEAARAIAKEAYIYGFPTVDNYRVMYSYYIDSADKEYKAGWNEVHSEARVYTPEDKAIQTPNSDTPYTMIGVDLRASRVLTLPPSSRDATTPHNSLTSTQLRIRRQPHGRQRRRQLPSRAEVEGPGARQHRASHL